MNQSDIATFLLLRARAARGETLSADEQQQLAQLAVRAITTQVRNADGTTSHRATRAGNIIDFSQHVYAQRQAALARRQETDRTFPILMASETPVPRTIQGIRLLEILDHGAGCVDMSFIASGVAPMYKDHRYDQQTGVVRDAFLGNRQLRGEVMFSRNELGEAEFRDVSDGIRSNASIGYDIIDVDYQPAKSEREIDMLYVRRWKPVEVSIVGIPADQTCGIGR